jgi:hypothetical protein
MAALLMVMDSVKMKPGTSGPGDEWKFPAGPDDEVKPAEEAAREPAHAARGSGLLHRLTRRG